MNEAHWFSKDGLMRLRPSPEASSKPTDNDNGLLFAAIYYMVKYEAGRYKQTGDGSEYAQDRARWLQALEAIGVEGWPGLTKRTREHTYINSHDNLAALYCGCVLFETYEPIRDAVLHGLETGFNYNDQAPTKWRLETWIQGAEVAPLKLCGGYAVTMWNCLWWLLANVVNSFQFRRLTDGKKTSETELAWLRQRAVLLAAEKFSNDWNSWAYGWTASVFTWWRSRLMHHTNGEGMELVLRKYYTHPENPIHLLAKERGVKW